jgi:hypothetical protein
MNAAALVQFASARGIDLQHVAGVASNLEGIARERKLTAIERKLGITDVRETATGRETRGAGRAGWGLAELGQAANGLGVVPWNAALYSFAGSQDGYWLLWNALSCEANRIARRDCWAPRVTTENGEQRFYRENLAALVLDHDANQHLFAAAPALYSAYMHVAPATWDAHLYSPFRSLRGRYESWLGAARSVIGKWIRREE